MGASESEPGIQLETTKKRLTGAAPEDLARPQPESTLGAFRVRARAGAGNCRKGDDQRGAWFRPLFPVGVGHPGIEVDRISLVKRELVFGEREDQFPADEVDKL